MYKKIEELVRNAGKMMVSALSDTYLVTEKTGNSDIVTEYDTRIQNYLESELSALYPEAKFLGEEGEHNEEFSELMKGLTFIIDPIDGTTNFTRNFFKSAVSVALAQKGEVIYGCCYIPYSDELFTAEKGKGAYCNGTKIHCAERDIEHSVVSFGTTPYNKTEMGRATFDIIYHIFNCAMDVRRFGSAVIDLLDVACGKCDMFLELRLSPWDYAAAGLIASEAGALVTDMKGNPLKYDGRYSLIAASLPCYDYFMKSSEISKYKDLF